ncbi:MAG TPA: hypothetical protein VFD84_15505 [Candidatus Binatia bacterium]|nr:hypothetical protein [Candidatus Binatia bacterium]
MKPRPRGFSVVEALVGAALAGIALAGLAAVAALATESLRLARDRSTALALATERLELLRAGPRADGAEERVGAGGTRFAVAWHAVDGRGDAARLRVHVAWGTRALDLATEAAP